MSDRSCLCVASHIILWESREDDAGQGAFIHSCPPHLQTSPFIKAGSILCVYGRDPITCEEFSQLTAQELEYMLSIERGEGGHYNSYRYNGENIGRYVNQGGLQEAFSLMLRLAQQRGPTSSPELKRKYRGIVTADFPSSKFWGSIGSRDRHHAGSYP